jgi:Methyltransferase domain
MSAVADKSVDAIFSSHNIEHVYPHEVAQVLNEFLRVLSDDGFVVLTCPDLQAVCEFVAADKLLEPIYESPVGPISPLDVFVWSSPGNRGRQPLYGPQMWIHLFSVDQTFPQQRI